jgi:hypothetical protein
VNRSGVSSPSEVVSELQRRLDLRDMCRPMRRTASATFRAVSAIFAEAELERARIAARHRWGSR